MHKRLSGGHFKGPLLLRLGALSFGLGRFGLFHVKEGLPKSNKGDNERLEELPKKYHVILSKLAALVNTYVFATQGEKDAFIDAVGAMVGESKCFCVPGPEFKPWVKDYKKIEETRQKLLDLVDPEHHAYVLKALEEDRCPIDGYGAEPIFIRRDGAFVTGDWGPSFAIEDEPVSPAAWSQEFHRVLEEDFGQDCLQLKASAEEGLRAKHERDPIAAARHYGWEQGLPRRVKPRLSNP